MEFSAEVLALQTDKAKHIIQDNLYITIATALPDGEPWVSPVYFNYDNDFRFYWVSYHESRHSILIRENKGRVAGVIFDSRVGNFSGDGVYIEGVASELNDEGEIKSAIEVFYSGRHKELPSDRREVSDYVGESPWRFYRLQPKSISKLTDGIRLHGYYIDKRMNITAGLIPKKD